MLKLGLLLGCVLAVTLAQAPPRKTRGDERPKTRELGLFEHILKVNNDSSIENSPKGTYTDGDVIRIDRHQMFEGDIVYTKRVRDHVKNLQAEMITGVPANETGKYDAATYGKWTGAKVYYDDSGLNLESRRMVKLAIDQYHKNTCIRFHRRSTQRNYIYMFNGGGCYSMIGMTGGRQQLSLGRGCYRDLGTPIHEIMHALGFYHEQSRRDRGKYIRINWQNMNQKMRYNFEMYQVRQAKTLGQPYDKQSVMHYGSYAFSQNGRPTIESLANRNEKLGQRRGFSAIDIKQLNLHYNCDCTEFNCGTGGGKETGGTNNEKDNYPFCRFIPKKSYCKSNSWVKSNCKKHCWVKPTRPPPTKSTCVDKNKYCGSWANSRYCSNSAYKGYMAKNCKKSCGTC